MGHARGQGADGRKLLGQHQLGVLLLQLCFPLDKSFLHTIELIDQHAYLVVTAHLRRQVHVGKLPPARPLHGLHQEGKTARGSPADQEQHTDAAQEKEREHDENSHLRDCDHLFGIGACRPVQVFRDHDDVLAVLPEPLDLFVELPEARDKPVVRSHLELSFKELRRFERPLKKGHLDKREELPVCREGCFGTFEYALQLMDQPLDPGKAFPIFADQGMHS